MAIQFFKRNLIKKTILLGILILTGCDERNPSEVQKAYITLQGSDKIAVVDINEGVLLETIDADLTNTSDMPHYIVIDETNNHWYCTLISSGHILKFNLTTNELIDSVHVGNMPALMEIDELNEYLYISRFMPMMGMSTASQLIHKIDAQSMAIVGTVDVGADSPHGIALSSDGKTLWVASNQASHFFQIETDRFGESNYQPQNYPIGDDVPSSYEINDGYYNALELELSHDNSTLFISCSNRMEVRAFSTSTGEFMDNYMTGMMPWHLQVSSDNSKLYVTNRMGSSYSVIDLDSGESATFTFANMTMMHGCALSGNEDHLVVTSAGSGNAYVFDTETNTQLHSIELDGEDSMPTGVAIVQ